MAGSGPQPALRAEPRGDPGRLGASPARRVLAAAGTAAAEQREQQAEEQGEQRARAHHALALVGLWRGQGWAGQRRRRAAALSAVSPQRTSSPHSPRRQAPVTGSHESSLQLQAWAQSTPWNPDGQVRLQLRESVGSGQAGQGVPLRPGPFPRAPLCRD